MRSLLFLIFLQAVEMQIYPPSTVHADFISACAGWDAVHQIHVWSGSWQVAGDLPEEMQGQQLFTEVK